MENKNISEILFYQDLINQQVELVDLELQLVAFQQQAFQADCGGRQVNGVYGRMEDGYGYQPSFDDAPRNDYYPQQNAYLPTTMEYPDCSYDHSYPLQPDTSQFMSNSFNDGAQDSYQYFGNEFPSSQEVWQQPQEVSPSLKAAFMTFMQETTAILQRNEASLMNLEDQTGLTTLQFFEGPNGISPSEVIVSPMEQCNSLTTNGMTSLALNESLEHENVELESVIENDSEEELDEFTPMVNEEGLITLAEKKLLQAIKEFTIVESQVLESNAILPSCDLLVVNTPRKNVDFGVEQSLASPNHLIAYGESEINVPCVYSNPLFIPCFYSNPLFEDNVKTGRPQDAKPYSMMVDMFDPLKEDALGEKKVVYESIAELEAKEPMTPYVHSLSFFEESLNYILQPQGLHPLLKELVKKEATWVPFDPLHFSIPWDPGGIPFDKFLPSNFKPP